MRCECCEKNEATKTYAKIKNGTKTMGYYCMDCFQRLFISSDETETGASLSACPYCGMTLDEVRAGKLVGCAYCYRTMRSGVFPLVAKMQGDNAHTGVRPPLSPEQDYDDLENFDEANRKELIRKARFEKQRRELQTIIDKLKAEGNFEDALEYASKLSAMRSKAEIEEEFVWRTRTSKQP